MVAALLLVREGGAVVEIVVALIGAVATFAVHPFDVALGIVGAALFLGLIVSAVGRER